MNRAAPEPKDNMGQPEPRIDGAAEGHRRSALRLGLPGQQSGVRVPGHQRDRQGPIQSMDLRDAKAVPGVLEIFTHENTGELKPVKFGGGGGGADHLDPGLRPENPHDGQIVAMVVADTFEAAREAAYRVRMSLRRRDAERDVRLARRDRRGRQQGQRTRQGTAAGRRRRSRLRRRRGQARGRIRHAGPASQCDRAVHHHLRLARRRADDLRAEPVHVRAQEQRRADSSASMPSKVHVVSPFVGGAFGSKAQLTPRTGLVALAAKKLNRPVKLVATRDQGFTIATYRAETRHRIRIGAQRDGKIVSFSHEGWEVTSRPDPYAVAGVEDSARLYGFGAVKTNVTLVHADRNTPGFMRSPPVVPYIYALESAMDELAVKLDMDPVELRRINDSMTDATGKPWSSRSLMKCYDQAAERFGWSKREHQARLDARRRLADRLGLRQRGLSDACRRRGGARAPASRTARRGCRSRPTRSAPASAPWWRRWRPSGSAFRCRR